MTKRKSKPLPPAADIRAWAKANGYEVGSRGRLSAVVLTAYFEANA